MKVKQLMHAGAQWVEPGTSLTELARLMREYNIGAIAIGENDRLVSMVTARDIVCRGLAAGLDLTKTTARDVMSKGIFYCRDTQEVADAARTIEQKKVRRLPVINEDKRHVNLLSEHLAHERARPLRRDCAGCGGARGVKSEQ